ncbi:MAG: hypothetical protein KIT22_04065 [Verrucomicrobiae bacterium]|nr:hypothetical protein [Verrucomicrobiae bacterium]
MKVDSLTQFERLRASMLRRKAEIEAELAALDSVLDGRPYREATPPAPVPATRTKAKREASRVENPLSLGDAIFSATKAAPLTKEEILAALEKLGYRFSGESLPIEEVGSVLQMDTRFEAVSGKYGPTLEALFPEA